MKLIACSKCSDLVMLIEETTRTCQCGEVAGKYLDDKITSVITENSILVGIDNIGFKLAKSLSVEARKHKYRIDYFFTGWCPNHGGEIEVVETVDDVIEYDYHLPEEKKAHSSTLPTAGQEN